MKNKRYWWWLLTALALGLVTALQAYVYSPNGATWLPGSIPINIKVGTAATSEHVNFSNSASLAMTTWNVHLGTVQFQPIFSSGGQVDYENDIYFDSTWEGEEFGSGVLAVTLSYITPSIKQLFETDIVFNTAYTWDSYSGAWRSQGAKDFHRVAIHELGHVLGLGHPDENGQPGIDALMNSHVSDLDHLTADDIAGAQSLYRAPGQTAPPGNDNFANAYVINLSSGTLQVAGDSYYATKEAGEPDHDPGDGVGGASVWWKWTAPYNGSMTLTTQGSHFDTLLGVYTGSAVNALNAVVVNDDVEPGVIRYSTATVTVNADTTYYIAVDGWKDADDPAGVAETGLIKVNLNFTPEVVNVPPNIITGPNSNSIPVGQAAQFSIQATGVPAPTYQWQRLPAGNGTWIDLADDGIYTGTATATLTISAATLAMNGDQFRCSVTNPLGSITSTSASLAVTPLAPSFTSHPVDQQKLAGASVTFSAVATGNPAPNYQWQKNGVDIVGATGSSYTRSNLTAADAGTYRVIAANIAGSATSNGAVLTVLIPPSFTTQPVDQTVVVGAPVTLTAAATGLPAPTYQWQKDAVDIPGATHTSYTIANTTFDHAGSYRVIASNAAGSATSNTVTLAVLPPGPTITSLSPTRQVYTLGQSTMLSVTATSASDAGIINYQWMHNGREIAGANSPALPLNSLTAADSGWYVVVLTDSYGMRRSAPIFLYVGPVLTQVRAWGSDNYSAVQVPSLLTDIQSVSAGNSYTLALRLDGTVTGWGGNINGWTSIPEGLSDVVAVAAGERNPLALKSDGTVIEWGYGIDYLGKVHMPDELTDVVSISAGRDHSLVLKSDGTVIGWGLNTSGQAIAPSGLTNAVAVRAGGGFSLALMVDGTVTAWGSNTQGETDVPVGLNNVVQIAAGGSHALALKSDGTIVAWGDNSNGQCTIPTGLTNVTAIAAGYGFSIAMRADGTVVSWGNNNFGQTTIPTDLADVFAVSAGIAHTVVIRDAGGEQAPIIINPPVSQSVVETQKTIFSVSAIGVGSISYQWRKNGVIISGATKTTYVIPNTAYADAGTYDVVVSNYIGSTISDPVTLTVNPPADITNIGTTRVVLQPGHQLSLKISATGVGPLTYHWSHNGNTIPGANQDTYTVTTAGFADSGWYLAHVSDDNGTTRSRPFFVSIVPDGTPHAPTQLRVMYYNNNTAPDLSDVIAIACGTSHTLALRSDGSIHAWGNNSQGQINVPAGLSGVVAVTAGGDGSMALKSDGTVVAWGGNSYTGPLTVPDGLSDVVAISTSGGHSLALKSDGSVIAWGYSYGGRTAIPVDLEQVVAVSAYGSYSMALKSNGTITTWGSLVGTSQAPPADLHDVIAISAGTTHALALCDDGTVVQWGYYYPNEYTTTTPMPDDLDGVVAIAIGEQTSYAVRSDGTVVGWGTMISSHIASLPKLDKVTAIAAGQNLYVALRDALADTPPQVNVTSGSLALTETQSTTFTANVSGAGPWSFQWRHNGAVIPGATSSTLNLQDLTVDDSGDYDVVVTNSIGSTTSNAATLNIIPLARITPVSAASQIVAPGQSLTLSATATGTGALSYQWTRNGRPIAGATGLPYTLANASPRDNGWYHLYVTDDNGTRRSPTFFVRVAPATTQIHVFGSYPPELSTLPEGLNDVVQVSGGSYHCLALRADGTVVAWGDNSYGQTTVPGGLVDVVAVSAAGYRSMALKSNGTVVSWGFGGGSSAAANDTVAIACGASQSLALQADGTVVAWGADNNNLLDIPRGLAGVVSIAMGDSYSIALKSDGTATVWGKTEYGLDSAIPPGLTNLAELVNGVGRTYAIKDDGTVIGWRYYEYGAQTLMLVIPEGLTRAQAVASGVAITEHGSVLSWENTESGSTSSLLEVDRAFAVASSGWVRFVLGDASTDTAPSIVTQPTDQTVTLGGEFILTVVAEGTLLTYEWRQSGLTLADNSRRTGVRSATLGVTNAQLADAGGYTVTVRNSQGSVTSQIATVTVDKLTQTITFPALDGRGYTQTVINLSATASSGLPVTFAVVSGPATITGTQLRLTGPGTVTVRATQAGDLTYASAIPVDRSFTVTGNLLSWNEENFTPSELADAAISGPAADPDGDSLSNLLEYALDLNPRSADTTGLPEMGTSATAWTYTYTRPTDRPDLTYEVEVSTDLVNWTTTGVTLAQTSTDGITETWQTTYPHGAATNVFFRLMIVQNE